MGNDLISRSALLEAFDNLQPPGFEKSILGMVALRMINGAPAVDAEPVRHGRWEEETDRVNHWHCSRCKFVEGRYHTVMKYCPICGAKMDGDADAAD